MARLAALLDAPIRRKQGGDHLFETLCPQTGEESLYDWSQASPAGRRLECHVQTWWGGVGYTDTTLLLNHAARRPGMGAATFKVARAVFWLTDNLAILHAARQTYRFDGCQAGVASRLTADIPLTHAP